MFKDEVKGGGPSKPKKPKKPKVITPPQPPNHTPIPTAPASEIEHGPHIVAPPRSSGPVNVTVHQYEPPKPVRRPVQRKSYLEQHPLIAEQIKDAQQNMDPFDLGRLLHTILENKYENETEKLQDRLDNKADKVRDYYSQAQAAENEGDLDYTEDNPLNPRLLKFPDPQGGKSPVALRQKMLEALADASGPVERDAIRRLFNGNQYEKGLIELATDRQKAIQYHADTIDESIDYHKTSLQADADRINAYNEKTAETNKRYANKPEWQKPLITDPNEPENLVADPQNFVDRFNDSANYQRNRKDQPPPTKQVGSVEVISEDEDNPLGVLGGPDTPTPEERDKSLPSSPIYEGNEDTSDSKFSKYISHPVGESLIWSLDKISRPLYGVNRTLDYVYSQDEDPENATHQTLLGMVTGKDLGSALEDMSFKDLGGAAKAFVKGITDGGLGNSKDPVFFHDVIKHNAAADPDANIYDHGWYQAVAGLGGDIAFDPLSYLSFGTAGIVKSGVRGARDARAAKQFYADEDKVDQLLSKFFEDAGLGDTISAKEARDLITGKVVHTYGFPQTASQKTNFVKRVGRSVRDLDTMAREAWAKKSATQAERRAALEAKAQEYRDRKELVLNDHGMHEVRDILEEHIASQVQRGLLPESALDRYSTDSLLTTMAMADRMDELDKFVQYHQKLAKAIFHQYDPLTETAPRLTHTSYKKNGFYGSQDNKYIQGLIKDRDTLERQIGPNPTEVESNALRDMDEKIHAAQEKANKRFQAEEKGSFPELAKHEAKLLAEGDENAVRSYAAKRKAAKEALAEEGVTYEGKNLREILGEDLFNDPRLKEMGIIKAAAESRRFIYKDPELKEIAGSVGNLRIKARAQAKKLKAIQETGNARKIRTYQKNYDDIQRALRNAERQLHEAQATRLLHNLRSIVETSGEGNLSQFHRAEALGGLKNEIQRRINALNGGENRYTGVEHQRTDVRRNESGEFEKPSEFLDSDGRWDSGIFEPHPAYFSDKQHYEDMLNKVTSQLEESRRSYWDQVVENIDLNQIPQPFIGKDGRLERSILKRYLNLNYSTGVWARKGDLQFPEWNNWIDEVASLLTREYHNVRHRIAHGKEQSLVNKVEDRAKEEFDVRNSQNVEEIAPMFRTKNGALTEDNLHRAVDEDNLFPYVRDPEHVRDELLLGKVSTNKRLEELSTPEDVRNANNAKKVVDELVAGVQVKSNVKTKKAKNALNDKQLQTRVDYLIKELTETGWHFTDDLEQNVVHIVNNRAGARQALSLPNIVGRRLFKDEHGMTLAEATDLRDRTLLKTVESLSPAWAEQYGSMTQRQFVKEALKDFDSFRQVMRGGPFKLSLIGKSEKEARTVKSGGKTTVLSPESAAGISRSDDWARKTWAALQTRTHSERVRLFEDLFRASRRKSAESFATKKKQFIETRKAQAREQGNLDVSMPERHSTTKEAETQVLDLLDNRLAARALSNKGYSTELQLKRPLNVGSPDHELLDYAKRTMKKDLHAEISAKKLAAEKATMVERASIEASIKDIERQLREIDAEFLKYKDRVFKAKALYEKELRTEAILRASRIPISHNNRRLRVSILGADFAVPLTEHLFRSVDLAAGAPLVKQTRETWRKAFGAPSKDLGIDLVTARARALGMTPDIIKRDVQILTHDFAHIRPEERQRVFKLARRGMPVDRLEGEAGAAIKKGFEDLLPYFQNKYMVTGTGDPLTAAEINRYLKPAFRVNLRRVNRRMTSADDIIEAIMRTYDLTGQQVAKSYAELKDPLEVLWNLRVGINQAAARKAMEHTIKTDFGVQRGYYIVQGKEKRVDNWSDSYAVVEDLKKQGWETIEELGNTHYFPPEAVKDIRKLLDMTAPGKANIVGDFIDAVNGVWKASVTIYNPGYWTRNTVGEIMSSWLAGVNTVAPYRRAAKMMRMANTKEAAELEALHSQFPLVQHALDGDKLPKGSDVAFTMANGEKITYERMLVAYNDMGLKTGFFNTEFRKQASLGSNVPGVAEAGAAHRKLRHWGENHEDWLRASHFFDVVAKSKKPFDEAIRDAATAVRRYHFDYTDFSNFEKTVMLRAFPFYKWTRKAMPLMAGQLFLRPGKMVMYPKAMNTISNQLSSQDFEEDTNGFMPNFTGIAPQWITNLMAYQVGTNNENGATAFRLSTPQMDALQSLTNLPGAAYTLFNPYAKTAIEQGVGHTLGNEIGNSGFDVDLTGEDNQYSSETMERGKHALRNLAGPWGNFTAKSMGKNRGGYDNNLSSNDVLSQLTGLGFYDMFFEKGGDDQDVVSNMDSVTAPAVGAEALERLLRDPRPAKRRKNK